jgi:FAD/FMN-containing dehydrogenase
MLPVIEALRRALGEACATTDRELLERHARDWSVVPPRPPLAVVRPRSTAEVATALKLCHAHGQPVVTQGGRTGVSGGAVPGEGDVALSLDRLSGIEAIDQAAATMTVKAGTALEVVQNAAREAGFFCPLDLGARGSCAIGGNIATNAGGNRVVRYGMTRAMVLGLEVVLADGTVLEMLNTMIKNNAGFDLKQLFIGSEGQLGVITRAVLKLEPLPVSWATAYCGLDGFAAAVAFLGRARTQLSGLLSSFEIMWPDYYDLIVGTPGKPGAPGIRAPLAGRHGMYVLIETQGADPATDQDRFERFMEGCLADGIIADAALAQSHEDARAFWAVRDATAEFSALMGKRTEFDLGLPIARIGACTADLEAALKARWPEAMIIFYGHLGDGNIHLQVATPGVEPHPGHAIEDLVYAIMRDHGGTVTAEHGLGSLKAPYLGHCRTEAEIALMEKLKTTLDPRCILNRGKVLEPDHG